MFYADKQWALDGNTYAGLRWMDKSPKPSDATLRSQYANAQAKEKAAKEIAELKSKLIETDYVALIDYDKDKSDVMTQRQQWRNRIRKLEKV
jgi:hypothetical protein